MQLILDVVKSGKNRPAATSFRFNECSGTIGRSDDAEYQLTDPQNYISGKHAFIEYKHGQYYLRDESTNGTFLKHPYKKLPKGVPHPISASEVYIIGDHELQARLSDNDYTDDFIVGGLTEAPEPLEAIEELIPDDDFLYTDEHEMPKEPEQRTAAEPRNDDVLDLIEEQDDMEALFFGNDDVLDQTMPEPQYDPMQSHMEMPEIRRPGPHPETAPERGGTDLSDSVRILEEKLGIEIISLESRERDALMRELADVVAHSLNGLRGSLHIKDKTKQDLRLPSQHAQMQENNPVKLGKSASQLLQNNSAGNRLGLMQLSTAVSRSFAEIDAHMIALHGASKNLMGIAASSFSPISLEYKLESMGNLRGPMPRACMLWKAYTQMFDRLNHDPDSGVEMLAPHFTKEYEKLVFSIGLTSADAV